MNAWDDAVAHLTADDWDKIETINARIQSHTGSWGGFGGGDEIRPGILQMPFARPDPLIQEFVALWYSLQLVVPFDWGGWHAGREWFADQDPTKYDKLDTQTALQLLTAVIRNDRFNEGALMAAFESGECPKIISSFASTRNQQR